MLRDDPDTGRELLPADPGAGANRPAARPAQADATPARVEPPAPAAARLDAVPPPRPPAAAPAARRRRWRTILMLLGPAVAIGVAVWLYLAGGRYVSTDNAYVQADKLLVTTDVAGTVAAVPVADNAVVQPGAVLFQLDRRPFEIALAAAQARLAGVENDIRSLRANYRQSQAAIEQAQTDVDYYATVYARQQNLRQRGVAAQSALDEARRDLDAARERLTAARREAEATLARLGGTVEGQVSDDPAWRAAKAAVEEAERELAHTTVTAPMAGIVTNVDALQVGAYLDAGAPAFALVGTQNLWVEANPKETDLTHVHAGDPATVTVDSYPGREFAAEVASLSPATGAVFAVLPPQNASGNWVKVVQRVPVRLALAPAPGAPVLRAGMSAVVTIDTGHERTLAGLAHDLLGLVGL